MIDSESSSVIETSTNTSEVILKQQKEKYQKKTLPTGPQREILITEYRKSRLPNSKQTICRFYLRGNCMFATDECHYAHGIQDLEYVPAPRNPNYRHEYSFTNPKWSEESLFRGELNYHVLNSVQDPVNPKYTLEEINNNRKIRQELRWILLDQQFQLFICKLQSVNNGETIFREQYVEEEYYRLGFNKLMTRVKYDFLIQSLCERSDSKWMLVKEKSTSFFVKKQSEEVILDTYSSLLQEYLENYEDFSQTLNEVQLRRHFYQKIKNKRIPMLPYILSRKKITLHEFIKQLIQRNPKLLKLPGEVCLGDESLQVLKEAEAHIASRTFCDFREVLERAKMGLNTKNNMSKLGNLKQQLILKGHRILQVATHTFVYNPLCAQKYYQKCPCRFDNEKEEAFQVSEKEQASDYGVVLVVNSQEKMKQVPSLFADYRVVAVDIEGKLRVGGRIQIIQIAVGSNVVLFDFDGVSQQQKTESTQLLLKNMRQFVRRVMMDASIVKVFHDARHDSMALHHLLNTCVRNVRDTSGLHLLKVQLQNGKEYSREMPKLPGLNELLSQYQASHGINPYKDQFHKLMGEGKDEIFRKRPLDERYLEYCVKDVQDLCEVAHKIGKYVPEALQKYVGECYIRWGYQQGLASK